MKLSTYLFLSPLFCFVINSTVSECPPFLCGNHTLEFPFTDAKKPECGVFMVEGCDSTDEYPRIQLEGGELRYDLIDAQTTKTAFSVRDSQLEKLLKAKSYLSLRNVSLSKSPFASLTLVPPYLTLFSCKSYWENQPHEMNRSEFTPLHNHDPKSSDSPECSIIQVPSLETKPNSAHNHIFDLLTSEFTLEWNVSQDCLQCHHDGGQCLSNSINEFYCKEVWNVSENCYGCHRGRGQCLRNTANGFSKKGKGRLVLILALSGGGLLLLLLCLLLFYVIWLLKKRNSVGYLSSRNKSFGPSKSSIDGGSSFFGIPIFSYTELEAATDDFDPSKELGDGGFGTVYYGKLRDGREVAIKRLYEQNCRRVEQFMNEIKILTSLRHPSLVCLYGCTSRRSRELLLVYEYIPNGTVAEHLHGDRAEEAPLTWPIRLRIAIETATAMAYLHKSDIIHRDVKTDNILLDNSFHVKVADFGLSRLFPNDATHISTAPGGTPGYIDPEYHQCYQVTDKSDVYSFGVVLIELISSKPAVDINRQTHEINLANLAVNRIQRCAFDELIDPSLGYNFDAEVTRMTTSVAEIAFLCLQLEKEMRPSMGEVLAFLTDICKSC